MNNAQLINILQQFPPESGVGFWNPRTNETSAIRYALAGDGATYFGPEGESKTFLIVLSRDELPTTKPEVIRFGPID